MNNPSAHQEIPMPKAKTDLDLLLMIPATRGNSVKFTGEIRSRCR
ncbi:hypothetical protein WMF31_39855 [Sorangium sp. So ce1036]